MTKEKQMRPSVSESKKIKIYPSFVNELRAIAHIIKELAFVSYQEPSKSGNDPIVVIGPGFISTGHPYFKLARTITERGYRVIILDPYNPNAHSYAKGKKRLTRTADDILQKYGRMDYFVGHSLGGIEGVMLLSQYNVFIKKVIAIGSPFAGTPSKILQWLTSNIIIPQMHQDRLLVKIVKEASPYKDRIVTVTTAEDRLCPPQHGAFPDARVNFIYHSHEDPKYGEDPLDEILNTHAGLPYFRPAQKLLFTELKTP